MRFTLRFWPISWSCSTSVPIHHLQFVSFDFKIF
jgi:hypothetical protein